MQNLHLAVCVFVNEAKRSWPRVRKVKLGEGKIYSVLNDPRWCSGPQPAEFQPKHFSQTVGETSAGWGFTHPPSWRGGLAHKKGPRKECAGGDDDRIGQYVPNTTS